MGGVAAFEPNRALLLARDSQLGAIGISLPAGQ